MTKICERSIYVEVENRVKIFRFQWEKAVSGRMKENLDTPCTGCTGNSENRLFLVKKKVTHVINSPWDQKAQIKTIFNDLVQ